MTATQRLDAISKTVAGVESDLKRSARLSAIVGVLVLALLAVYFIFGYRMIKELLQPATLVPYGASMLEARLPEARQALAQQVASSAPGWAAQASTQLREYMPELRKKLQEYILTQTDAKLGEAIQLSEDQLRTAIRANKEVLDQGFRELADHEQLSDASLEAITLALEKELQADLKEQSAAVLETVTMLNARVQELSRGEGLDEEEQKERRVLMLARALQFKEADPTPIAIPVVKVTLTAPASEGEQPAQADVPAPETTSDKPVDAPAPSETSLTAEPPASN
jgi:hypothetical protein